jgi:Protein of unknown function (DUF742)
VSGNDGLDDDEPTHEEESFGRPFLGRAMRAEPGVEEPADDAEANEAAPGGHLHPYLLTGGRTGGGASGIGIETVLVRDEAALERQPNWSTQLSLILMACELPVAVAEVAARVGLPLGVVQVLAGDLVASGVLIRSSSTTSLADDVFFIERLIHGVAAL